MFFHRVYLYYESTILIILTNNNEVVPPLLSVPIITKIVSQIKQPVRTCVEGLLQ